MIQLYEFIDYKIYLKKALNYRLKSQKGVRSRLAEAISCRSGYITQVLEGAANLSLEQADFTSQFLGHTDEESEYFLLLVIYERAGTKQLKGKIEKQIRRNQELHLNLKNRFKVNIISEESQMILYSSWQYLAILTLIGVPKFQSKESLSEYLQLPLKRISEIFETLEQHGLISFKNGRYFPEINRTHLGKDSPMISKHHINWRLKAIQSIEKQVDADLHYSSVVSLAVKDVPIVKERLIKALEETSTIISPSKEECVFSLCMDFFGL